MGALSIHHLQKTIEIPEYIKLDGELRSTYPNSV